MTVWFVLGRTALMDRTAFPERGCSAAANSNCTQPTVITEITYGRQGGRGSLSHTVCHGMGCSFASFWQFQRLVYSTCTPNTVTTQLSPACMQGPTSTYLCHLPWCPRYQLAYATLAWLCTVHHGVHRQNSYLYLYRRPCLSVTSTTISPTIQHIT